MAPLRKPNSGCFRIQIQCTWPSRRISWFLVRIIFFTISIRISIVESCLFDTKIETHESKVKKRIVLVTAPSVFSAVNKEEDQIDVPKIQGPTKPLKHLKFFLLVNTSMDKEDLTRQILSLSGLVKTKIHKETAAIISSPEGVEKMNKRMREAQELDITVITADFIEEANDFKDIAVVIKNKMISRYGGDRPSQITSAITEKSTSSKSKSPYEKSSSRKIELTVKDGNVVDPDSRLEERHQEGRNNKYSVTETKI